jgi:hypothetical protein
MPPVGLEPTTKGLKDARVHVICGRCGDLRFPQFAQVTSELLSRGQNSGQSTVASNKQSLLIAAELGRVPPVESSGVRLRFPWIGTLGSHGRAAGCFSEIGQVGNLGC